MKKVVERERKQKLTTGCCTFLSGSGHFGTAWKPDRRPLAHALIDGIGSGWHRYAVCAWRGFAGRLPGVDPRPTSLITVKTNPISGTAWSATTTAWIALLVPFTINLVGLAINFFTGKWMINELFARLYYVLAGSNCDSHDLDATPRARRSPGERRRKSLVLCDGVDGGATQLAGWAMWRMGRYFKLSGSSLDHSVGHVSGGGWSISDPGVTEQVAAHAALSHPDKGCNFRHAGLAGHSSF